MSFALGETRCRTVHGMECPSSSCNILDHPVMAASVLNFTQEMAMPTFLYLHGLREPGWWYRMLLHWCMGSCLCVFCFWYLVRACWACLLVVMFCLEGCTGSCGFLHISQKLLTVPNRPCIDHRHLSSLLGWFWFKAWLWAFGTTPSPVCSSLW